MDDAPVVEVADGLNELPKYVTSVTLLEARLFAVQAYSLKRGTVYKLCHDVYL